MFDLNAINSAKKKAKVKQEKTESSFDEEYDKAVAFLKEFAQEPLQETLNKAAEYFFNALKIKRNKVDVYFFIAYIFYLMGNKEMALEYIDYARLVNPDFGPLSELNNFIISI